MSQDSLDGGSRGAIRRPRRCAKVGARETVIATVARLTPQCVHERDEVLDASIRLPHESHARTAAAKVRGLVSPVLLEINEARRIGGVGRGSGSRGRVLVRGTGGRVARVKPNSAERCAERADDESVREGEEVMCADGPGAEEERIY